MERKTIVKFILSVIFVGACVSVFLALMTSISCVSAPERIDGEPQICSDSKYIAYAFHRNQKVPETVISNGLASCRNQLIWNFCEQKTTSIQDELEKERAFQKCWDKNKSQ